MIIPTTFIDAFNVDLIDINKARITLPTIDCCRKPYIPQQEKYSTAIFMAHEMQRKTTRPSLVSTRHMTWGGVDN
jgi:hypothetical protein